VAREFITAVEQKEQGGKFAPIPVVFGKTILNDDGEEEVERREVLFHPPAEGQVTMMMARMGRHSSTNDKIAGIIDFFVEMLAEDDHQYVVDRLLDRTDPFGVQEVTETTKYLVEEWSQRPTK
jgi:hypothetical protein